MPAEDAVMPSAQSRAAWEPSAARRTREAGTELPERALNIIQFVSRPRYERWEPEDGNGSDHAR